jgi:hypothetical protein
MCASACVSTCPRVTVPLAVHRDRVGLVRSIVRFSSNRAAHPRGTRGVSGRHCATRVDEWSRAGRALVFFVCVVVANARGRGEPVVGTGTGRSTDGRTTRACCGATARGGGDARCVCVCPRGGKLTNNESWIDDNHGDRVIDASRGVDVVGARAKRRARDVVATAGMRPRDAKRFVSSGRRERSRRDANVDVGDGAERRGPGPDRGRAGRAEELEEELEQVKPRHRRVEERERDERRG